MFSSVLIANRGEIAIRIARTLATRGVRSVAIFTDADAGSAHTRHTDTAVPVTSYLDADDICRAAVRCGAQAVHPGYGFLSESPAFASACTNAGLAFIGPPAAAIAAMGDKINAKRIVSAAGVPVVPGGGAVGMDEADLAAVAAEVGYPVLLKPSAGGGGKGMRLVAHPAELPEAIVSARRESRNAFGDDTLLVERFVRNPRHIEFQVVADNHGNAVSLGERECSLQRRHQKVIEEAPSVLLSPRQRDVMGAAAVAAARAVDYTGVGTVEFIVAGERPDEFFFLEMNTRLQVEHPVTEAVTGIDLVDWQLRIAAGETLPSAGDDVGGHAVEARIYAEDAEHGFLPSAGPLLRARWPVGDGIRVDAGVETGDVVGTSYDPMLAKVIAHGRDRSQALRRLDAALAHCSVLGVRTNTAFLRRLLADPDVVAGRLDTGLIERLLERAAPPVVPDEVWTAAALYRAAAAEPVGAVDPFDLPGGWRLGEHAPLTLRLRYGEQHSTVRVWGRAGQANVAVGDDDRIPAGAWLGGDELRVTAAGTATRWSVVDTDTSLWLGRDGASWEIRSVERESGSAAEVAGSAGPVISPMPGTVVSVSASVGDEVTERQTLIVVEAMKMEHALTAPADGVLERLSARPGQRVALGEVLAVVAAHER